MQIKTKRSVFICIFALSWLALLIASIALSGVTVSALASYVKYSLLGVLGAIFANSTGAGGGVIFIPFFNQLEFTELQAIATSFGIQCFGMTAGAITWYAHYQKEKKDLRLWQGFKRTIVVCSIFSVLGVWLTYIYELPSPASLHQSFSWFSLVLGLFIVLTIYLVKPTREHSQLDAIDYIAFSLIGLVGGALTQWLSVGVGELLAIYLILRRFDVTMAVAAAVVVSAITVWSAIWQHTLIAFNVYWQVVVFAGPGAILGGIFARTLVGYLSATKLKLFFATWLLVIGFVGI